MDDFISECSRGWRIFCEDITKNYYNNEDDEEKSEDDEEKSEDDVEEDD